MKTIEWPLGDHRAQGCEEFLDLLRGQDRGGLIHDQDLCAAVEHLEDLDPLLLAHRELPDLGPRVDLQADIAPASARICLSQRVQR